MDPHSYSPHQRRWERRLSRDVNEALPIETYLYRCDPYRSSTVQHPWPYGVKVTQELAMRELILAYKNDIRDTFIRHGFPSDGSGVKLNFTVKRVFPADQRPSTVLSIGIENDPIPTRDLSIVRDAVYLLLLDKRLKTMHVDIFDCDRRFMPFKAQEDIVRLLRDKDNLSWQAICLYQVGRCLDQAVPCIVVSVPPGTIYNWASLRNEILDALGSDIEVEFLPVVPKLTDSCA
ncbi:hypothetical protein TSTA_064680 [Talaromyces stipitatus ATCC 10500]|uniref:Uncharacterized protein n=1 Tax=Talaromyces stipitatus (strain ATCC 10500 / CBS 375.48 / QM 6759 / NRRL 1006) TaxID=441959 RepID=B8LT06_TALSN|nr:uncharacterized protein TSTA_064680 [Talaromyces stipitatus ATCC 10500]EED23002.1 hypothetical protein TSTA_064680 [Talaromyces stipitatus ATCC 10500]